MKDSKLFAANLFEKIFELNSNNKIGASTIAVFTFILYKCEELEKEIVLSDYEMARELGLSRQTVITAKNKLKRLEILDYERNRGFPNRFILGTKFSPKHTEEKPGTIKIKEIPKREIYEVPEPKQNENTKTSKFPTLQQFMQFAKTLNNYSEKLDESLVQKFHLWENSGWNNAVGRPILDWKSVLKVNLSMLKVSPNNEDQILYKLPTIERPKVD